MYTILQDMSRSEDRLKIKLDSAGRSEFRKDIAKGLIVLSLVMFALAGVLISATNLTTTQMNYANNKSDIQQASVHTLKVALFKLN